MSPRASLDEAYFGWLYRNVGPSKNRNPARSYWLLAEQLHNTEFRWKIANDDNRAEDGIELRELFLQEKPQFTPTTAWLNARCSVLEMIIALARRTAFEADGDADEWTGILLHNLGFHRYTDAVWDDRAVEDVDDVLRRLIARRYGQDGTGGLFPLRYPADDQRRVELWYQMSTYLLERLDIVNA